MKTLLLACVLSFAAVAPALADGPVPVTIKDHKFTPAQIHVKANQPTVLMVSNEDGMAEEFDSTALKVEKVIGGHDKGDVHLRPLDPGRYPFMGEYHSSTAQGVVIAE